MTLASSTEKNTGPTPGPWRVEDVGFPPGHLAIMAGSATEYRWLATVGEDLEAGIDWTQTQANARLVAASLDLLEALKDCRNELFKRIDRLTADMPDDVRQKYLQFPPIVKADAAIAKAEGREP